MKVFTLLYSRSQEDDVGNFVFFDTFKKGFPKAELFVYSNKNTSQFNKKAEELTYKNSGKFFLFDEEVEHDEFISYLIHTQDEPFYLIDPDTIWFEEMPGCFDSALAGRFIPRFYDSYVNANTFERLHTSCLYICPKKIKQIYRNIYDRFNLNYSKPFTYYLEGKRYRFDTTAQLYQLLKNYNLTYAFDESIDKKFCHLFCGSHISFVSEVYPRIKKTHKSAIENVEYAKKLKKEQDLFFLSKPWI